MRFHWIPLILISLFSSCSSIDYNYSLTESDLESYLGDNFSYQQQIGQEGLAEITTEFGDLNVELGPENSERIAISGTAEVALKTLIKDVNASLTGRFSAIPWYDTEKGAIYLKELEIDSVEVQPNGYKPLINPFSERILHALQLYLEKNPVYVLDKHDMRQALAIKFGKSIQVKPGQIDFVLTP